MKRSVKFSYLDYSTPERRRHFCELELRVNRRTAPQIYESVEPVMRRPDGSLTIGGPGTPVDWLVVMARFDQSDIWDSVADRHALTPAMLTTLGDSLAYFHSRASAGPEPRASGKILRTIQQIASELARFVPGVFDSNRVDALKIAAMEAFSPIATLLDKRGRTGAVRRCHGDLHLRNICQFDGVPTLFDAIEFNDDLAVIDVLYDLSFLIMDLETRGLRPEANLLFNRYLGWTRDYRGIVALPLFVSLRAAIRAHVLASTALHAGAGTETNDQARQYLETACDALATVEPQLIVVGGMSGSGKSTLARALAAEMKPVPGAVHLQSDVIRKRLAGVAPETALGEEHYSNEMSRRVYTRLRREAGRAMAAGYTVIADATYLDQSERAAIEKVAQKFQADFVGLWLNAPREEMERRVANRRNDASDATVDVVRRQMTSANQEDRWHSVNTAGGFSTTFASVTRLLRTRTRKDEWSNRQIEEPER